LVPATAGEERNRGIAFTGRRREVAGPCSHRPADLSRRSGQRAHRGCKSHRTAVGDAAAQAQRRSLTDVIDATLVTAAGSAIERPTAAVRGSARIETKRGTGRGCRSSAKLIRAMASTRLLPAAGSPENESPDPDEVVIGSGPVSWSGTPGSNRRPSPWQGEHPESPTVPTPLPTVPNHGVNQGLARQKRKAWWSAEAVTTAARCYTTAAGTGSATGRLPLMSRRWVTLECHGEIEYSQAGQFRPVRWTAKASCCPPNRASS
jgi:hypothetical protein